jgi:uncharacterized protein YecE (DUF72 family)
MASRKPTEKIPLTREQRREKRALRREKQRAANGGRAAKMHKARIEALLTPAPNAPPKINVGCSGWFYWHWKGRFYPAGAPTKDWFAHYRAAFRTVELNASFYSWPTLANVAGWKRQAGRRMVYTVKVCELITHVKGFIGTKTLVKDFGYIADLLDERMGCFLFQLPPSFAYTPARLRRIVAQLDPLRRNVVEFRHKSWWNETVYKAFRKAGIIFCACSAPRLPDELVKTANDIYIRFHGVSRWYRHDYSDAELDEWAQRIKALKPGRVWAYFNNDFGGNAVRNAKAFEKKLTKLLAS